MEDGKGLLRMQVCEAKEFYVAYEASVKEGVITEADIGGISFSLTSLYYLQALIFEVLWILVINVVFFFSEWGEI